MLAPLFAYDGSGKIVATQEYMVAKDAAGNVIGLIDFEAHELAGGKLRDIWVVQDAVGSGTWPEWLGIQAHSFRVEIGPTGRIDALVHQVSGFRRERIGIVQAIAAAPMMAGGLADLRAILGGPNRPLILDALGRTVGRSPVPSGTSPTLPVVGLAGG